MAHMLLIRVSVLLWPSEITRSFSIPQVNHLPRAHLRRLLQYHCSLIKHAKLFIIVLLLLLFFFGITDAALNSDSLTEATEMEYLRKVLFEYMMGRETKVGS